MVCAIFSNNDNSVGYMFNVHIVSVYVPISREGWISLLCWCNTSFTSSLTSLPFFFRVMQWCCLRSQQDIKILSHFLLLCSHLWRDYGQILECSTALEDPANINLMILLNSKLIVVIVGHCSKYWWTLVYSFHHGTC